jgi:hypothetical protein
MKPEFTPEQIDYVCYKIGEWYLQWRHCIADFEAKTHNLGFAKEKLKDLLFPRKCVCGKPAHNNGVFCIDILTAVDGDGE